MVIYNLSQLSFQNNALDKNEWNINDTKQNKLHKTLKLQWKCATLSR